MKKFFALLLALMLLTMHTLAEEEHSAHVFAPEGAGIQLTMDHEWFHALSANLLATYSRDSADPCEYSYLHFVHVPEDAETVYDGMLLFSLSNRLEGSDHVPSWDGVTELTENQLLTAQDGRELLIWHCDDESLAAYCAEKALDAATLRLPIDRILANPGDVAMSEPTPLAAAVNWDGMYGINAVDSTEVTADVFAGHKLTMLNIWATYCNPCISEMPELAKLHADYADKGVQVIGIVTDAETSEAPDAETVEYAQAIIDQTGANYLHVIPGEGLYLGALSSVTAVPTTYFVDENGNLVGEEYVGSRDYDAWASIIDELLAEME